MTEEIYPVEFEPKKLKEAVAWQVDPADDLNFLFNSLGWVYNKELGRWQKTEYAIVGERGFFLILHYATRIMLKAISLSNLNEDEIEKLVLMNADDITLRIGLQPWLYDIRDEDVETIINTLINFTKTQFNKALKGFTAEGINAQTIRSITEGKVEEKEKKGIGGIHLPFFGKKEGEE